LPLLVSIVQLDNEGLEAGKVEVLILDFGKVVLEARSEASTKFGSDGGIVPLKVIGESVELGDVADDSVI
jgi:hypothetical protein